MVDQPLDFTGCLSIQNKFSKLTWLTYWLNCTSLIGALPFACLVLALFLHLFLSFVCFSVVVTGSLVPPLIRSIRFFLGLLLFLFLQKSSFIIRFWKHSSFSWHTCPNQVRRLFRIMFSILFCCFALFCISLMEPWSCSPMFIISLRKLFSNMLNFLLSKYVRDHTSEPYIVIGTINVL